MTRSDWFMIWRKFAVWHKACLATGEKPSWRKQQNRIHKIVEETMAYRKTQPVPATGKRPVGRPRKVILAPMTPENLGRPMVASTEPLPKIQIPGAN